jgi:hypothetical protein
MSCCLIPFLLLVLSSHFCAVLKLTYKYVLVHSIILENNWAMGPSLVGTRFSTSLLNFEIVFYAHYFIIHYNLCHDFAVRFDNTYEGLLCVSVFLNSKV